MTSKYLQIYHFFVEQIENEQLKKGDYLPSESMLMSQFGVSRDTVRRALTHLEQNHYILKRRGKESIVLERERYNFPLSKITSFAELAQQQGLQYETLVEDVAIIQDDQISQELGVSKDTLIYRVIRVRKIDNERIILDKDYFVKDTVGQLSKDICEKSIYQHLENTVHLTIGTARKIITVERATKEDQFLLDLQDDPYVAVVSSYTELIDGTVFQYTQSRHRVDKFRFIEFGRR